jgi:long-chain acyl-CoA synthetase
MNKQKTVLLTGATGLVGSYLLKILLQKGYKVNVLARGKGNKSARDRVIDVLNFWDKDVLSQTQNPPESPHTPLWKRGAGGDFKVGQGGFLVLEGDITKKNLGLNKQNIDLLKNKIEEIFHCAAVTQINLPLKEARKVNVVGTKNVLEMAVKCKEKGRLKKVNHISTAYICGDYKGVFKEDDLDVGQKFNSTYGQSKFEAERLVEKYRERGLWIDVFRPPIIIGESNTGKILQFRNIYEFLHICKLELFNALPLLNLHIHCIPIDYAAKSIIVISTSTKKMNKNYHLFAQKPISLSKIISLSGKLMEFKKPKIVSQKNFNITKFTPSQRLLLNFLFNLNLEVQFNSRNTVNYLKKNNFKMPKLNNILFSKIVMYFARIKPPINLRGVK